MGLSFLFKSGLPMKYQDNAFSTSVYLINRLPTKIIHFISPLEKLFCQKNLITLLFEPLAVFIILLFVHTITINLNLNLPLVLFLVIVSIIKGIKLFYLLAKSLLLGISSLMNPFSLIFHLHLTPMFYLNHLLLVVIFLLFFLFLLLHLLLIIL